MKSISTIYIYALSALLAGLAGAAHADTAVQLLKGTSDAFTGEVDMQLLVNTDNVATGFQYVAPTKTQAFDLDQIRTGMVLMVYDNQNVVTLTSPDFDPAHGGTLDIHYLENGVSGTYQDLTLQLVNSGTTWDLMDTDQSGSHVVTEGYFTANKFFGQVIGISSITLD